MKSLIAFALLGAAACLHAQTPNTVNVVTPTACITSIDGTPISGGTLTVFAPGQNQQAAPFTSTTGLVVSGTATRPISGGQIVGSLVLPNPAVTSPVNVGYTFTITGNSSSAKTTYASVFISPDGSGNLEPVQLAGWELPDGLSYRVHWFIVSRGKRPERDDLPEHSDTARRSDAEPAGRDEAVCRQSWRRRSSVRLGHRGGKQWRVAHAAPSPDWRDRGHDRHPDDDEQDHRRSHAFDHGVC